MRSKEESAILIPNCVIIPLITAPCVWQIIPPVERLESKARLKDAVIFESRIFSRNDDRLYRFISYLNVLSADEFSMNDEDNAGNELLVFPTKNLKIILMIIDVDSCAKHKLFAWNRKFMKYGRVEIIDIIDANWIIWYRQREGCYFVSCGLPVDSPVNVLCHSFADW